MTRTAVVMVVAILASAAGGGALGHRHPAAAWPARGADHAEMDHSYRIIGNVRLLFFWVSAEDVGGACIRWRATDRARTLALLIGSDPERAPREINEWGYIREEVFGDSASVFGIRTITDGESPEEADARRKQSGRLAEFGVLCSRIGATDAESRTTTVYVRRDATYRHLDRVLDSAERSTGWRGRQASRPAAVAPGFLTALDQLMRSNAEAARQPSTVSAVQRLGYIYRDAVCDLFLRRIERVPLLRTRAGVRCNLQRAEFAVRNRASGSTTGFWITYGTEGALTGVPVQAGYQPNWWFRVELELDEGFDVPADSAGDESIRQRIDALCGRASARDATVAKTTFASAPDRVRLQLHAQFVDREFPHKAPKHSPH